MSDSIFGKIKGVFIEEEPGDAKPTPVAVAPKPVLAASIAPAAATVSSSTDGPTPEEIKAAEMQVSNWTGFRSLENLKKFASIEAKLKTKITDPEALRVATFEMAEMASLDKAVIVSEAKSAVSKLHVKLTESTGVLQGKVSEIETAEKTETINVVNNITEVDRHIEALTAQKIQLQATLADIPTKYQIQRTQLARQHDLTQQLAVLFIDQWSPVTESK